MKQATNIGLADVQGVYSGPEGELWELVMGQQIHIGGFQSSLDLAERAGIGPGLSGVDLCCCTGAGMRFLVRFRNVARMHGRGCHGGRDRTGPAALPGGRAGRPDHLHAGRRLPDGPAIRATSISSGARTPGATWWTKARLIAEASRLVRPGGVIAFTDWIEGPQRLTDGEAERLLRFMKFPNIQDLDGYAALLSDHGCEVLAGGRHRPFCSACRSVPEHAEHAVDLRCVADHRVRYRTDGIAGRRNGLHAAVGPCRQDRPGSRSLPGGVRDQRLQGVIA